MLTIPRPGRGLYFRAQEPYVGGRLKPRQAVHAAPERDKEEKAKTRLLSYMGGGGGFIFPQRDLGEEHHATPHGSCCSSLDKYSMHADP